jgi:hypothetical protein
MHDETATVVPPVMLFSGPFCHIRISAVGSWLLRVSSHVLFAAALVVAVVTPPSAQPAAPTPQSVIGWEPCGDYKLATYEQIEDYFRKFAAAVPGRMKLVEMGKTTEGRVQVIEKGRVILLGFRTQHRGQSHRTCKLLFSAILLGDSLT